MTFGYIILHTPSGCPLGQIVECLLENKSVRVVVDSVPYFCVVSKLTQVVHQVGCLIQVVDEDEEEQWPENRALDNLTQYE